MTWLENIYSGYSRSSLQVVPHSDNFVQGGFEKFLVKQVHIADYACL
jgi:hypothetical protein